MAIVILSFLLSTSSGRHWVEPSIDGMSNSVLPFDIAAKKFDWQFLRAQQQANRRLTPEQMESVAEFLIPYMHPVDSRTQSKLNTSPPPMTVDCSNPLYSAVLTGERRDRPVKLIDFVPFANEISTLEIRLYELNDTVDTHVITEGLYTHRGFKKPLFLELYRDRIEAFRHKIVRVVGDDTDQYRLREFGDRVVWQIEQQMRWLPLKKYEAGYGAIDADTLIIHGDCDEIPSRHALLHLKHCHIRKTPLVFSLDFYIFSFMWQFKLPIQHQPIVFKRSDVTRNTDGTEPLLRRSMGSYPKFPLHTGAHMNRFLFSLVDKVYKEAAMAEGGTIDFEPFEAGIWTQTKWIKTGLWNGYVSARAQNTYVPWFADSNRARYPWLFVDPSAIDQMNHWASNNDSQMKK
jgi:hypothetical protein